MNKYGQKVCVHNSRLKMLLYTSHIPDFDYCFLNWTQCFLTCAIIVKLGNITDKISDKKMPKSLSSQACHFGTVNRKRFGWWSSVFGISFINLIKLNFKNALSNV